MRKVFLITSKSFSKRSIEVESIRIEVVIFLIEVEHAWPIELFNRGGTFRIEMNFFRTHKRNPRSTSTMLSVSSIPSKKIPPAPSAAAAASPTLFKNKLFTFIFLRRLRRGIFAMFLFPYEQRPDKKDTSYSKPFFLTWLALLPSRSRLSFLPSRSEPNRRRTSCYQGPEQKNHSVTEKKRTKTV